MPFVPDLVMRQFHDQLYARHCPDTTHEVLELFIPYHISFQQPEKVQMFEFREQVFPVKLIVVKKVRLRIAGLLKFVHRKKIIPLPFGQLDLYAVIDAKVKSQAIVQLPAELVVFDRSYHTQQTGVLEELPGHILYVELQLHFLVPDQVIADA